MKKKLVYFNELYVVYLVHTLLHSFSLSKTFLVCFSLDILSGTALSLAKDVLLDITVFTTPMFLYVLNCWCSLYT